MGPKQNPGCGRCPRFSWMWHHPLACLVAQASCSCKPGLVNKNYNASAGCSAYCFPHSCDRSATCQVTPDGKTR